MLGMSHEEPDGDPTGQIQYFPPELRAKKFSVTCSVLEPDTRRWVKLCVRGLTCAEVNMLYLVRFNYNVGVDDDSPSPLQLASSSKHFQTILFALKGELDRRRDLTAATYALNGDLLSWSVDACFDVTPGTHYALRSKYQIPDTFGTIARDQLVEVKRIRPGADLVVPKSSASSDTNEWLVFKYYTSKVTMDEIWNAVHICARLGSHPNIMPLRHLVVDEADPSRVVGYTAPWFHGGSLDHFTGTFKLKWAKQLFQAVDDLHLKYGIVHNALFSANLVIDRATDNLVVIDFGDAVRIGTGPPGSYLYDYRAAIDATLNTNRNLKYPDSLKYRPSIVRDIGHVCRLIFSAVTRDSSHRVRDIKKGGWRKHPNAELDSPAHAFRKALMDWLEVRNAAPIICHWTEASEPLDYPDYMPPPLIDIDAFLSDQAKRGSLRDYLLSSPRRGAGLEVDDALRREVLSGRRLEDIYALHQDTGGDFLIDPIDQTTLERLPFDLLSGPYKEATSGRSFLRATAARAGIRVISWPRPATSDLDPARRLLANGEYEEPNDEEPPTKRRRRRRRSPL